VRTDSQTNKTYLLENRVRKTESERQSQKDGVRKTEPEIQSQKDRVRKTKSERQRE
jgi:hypothetical protein